MMAMIKLRNKTGTRKQKKFGLRILNNKYLTKHDRKSVASMLAVKKKLKKLKLQLKENVNFSPTTSTFITIVVATISAKIASRESWITLS